MINIKRLAMIFMLIFMSVGIALSQTHPLGNIIQEGFNPQGATPAETTLPDPMNLPASWWQYFEVKEGAELQERLEAFITRIEEQLDVLDSEQQKEYLPKISHIKANFAAYVSLKEKEAPLSAPKEIPQESYNIRELMSVIHRERDLSAQVSNVEQDIYDQEKQSRNLVRQLDNQMVIFLEMSANDPTRFSTSLNLILIQTEIGLLTERLRLQRRNLENLEAQVADMNRVRDSAIDRLTFTEEERSTITERLRDANSRLQEANIKLLREQSQLLLTPEETAEDRAVARLRHQRVLREKINIAVLEARLFMRESEWDSLQILSDDEEEFLDVERIQKRHSDRQRAMQELLGKAKDWFNQNEVERGHSNSFLADIESRGGSEQNSFLAGIARDRLALIQETSVLLQKLQIEVADVQFMGRILEKQLLQYQGVILNSINRTKSTLSYTWRHVKQSLRTALFKVGDTPVTALSFAQFLVIVLACWWVAFWLNRILYRIGNKRGDEKLPAYYIVGRLVYYGIILFGFLYALTAVGIDFTNFALVAGALAIGLGFGLQSIVNNFVSGLILLFERSIKVGDFIELQDQVKGRSLWGEVKEINVRATIISDNDNVDIVIPNSEFINTKMMNWTLKEPQRRMRYPFRVAYGTDKELVREAVLEAAEALPHTLKGIPGRNPAVWLTDFKEFYYEFELVVWLTARAVKRPNGVRAAYMWAIDTALRENNIEIPVPQREHRFREGEILPVERFEGGRKIHPDDLFEDY